jgi:hypothetical protein
LGRAHACGHIALPQARFHTRCNQFTGQLKLGRLCFIGLANGGIGQQFGFHVFQAFHVDSSKRFNAVSMRFQWPFAVWSASFL